MSVIRHHKIRGFNIPVNDSPPVQILQNAAQFPDHAKKLFL